MKVFELMSILADMPSGANINCLVTLTSDTLEKYKQFHKDNCEENNEKEIPYSIYKRLLCVDENGDGVCLSF